ncbi:unnamed protein product [Clonostachys rhizophaga]|uniref:Uncharacterized protein n=1 Tax=Clonostachys rhizophaga TaxID=160324 RepID=A0A9N9YJI0_9HYPO|nr:unnamed protein product [Clonostachys rhizophaga]
MFTTLRRRIRRALSSPRSSPAKPPSPPSRPRPVLTATDLQAWVDEPNLSQAEIAARRDLAAKMTAGPPSEHLVYPGDLTLSESPLSSLPPGFEVQGGLYIYNCFDLHLPAGLVVGGDFTLSSTWYRTHFVELQSDTYVGGDLSVSSTDLKELPERLEVGGIAIFYGCKSLSLKNIPPSVTIKEGVIKVTDCEEVWEEFDLNRDLGEHYGTIDFPLRDALTLRVCLGCLA